MKPRRFLDHFFGVGNRPLWSYLHTGTLPRLISFICHSCVNTGGVGVFFPNWNGTTRASPALATASLLWPIPYSLGPKRSACRGPVGERSRSQIPTLSEMIPITPLAATLMDLPASVANKRLTDWLSPLDATLTKKRGVDPSGFHAGSDFELFGLFVFSRPDAVEGQNILQCHHAFELMHVGTVHH